MCAVEEAALAAGGHVTGIIPTFMIAEGWHHTGLTELIETASMHERKQMMADLSDGAIALPGGCGTFEELLEIITWKQLGLYLNPVIILNIDGYYDHLIAQLNQAIDENFMRDIHGDIWKVATTPQEAIELLYTTPKWNGKMRGYAASDFHHGPIAQVNAAALVFVINPTGKTEDDSAEICKKLLNVGADVVVVTDDAKLAPEGTTAFVL